MPSVAEIIVELDGNGITPKELIEVTTKISEFAELREDLKEKLSRFYEEKDLKLLIGSLEPMGDAKSRKDMSVIMNKYFSVQQKEVYLKAFIEHKPLREIASDMNISSATARHHFEAAESQVKKFQTDSSKSINRNMWEKIIEDTPSLTVIQKRNCLNYFVEGKTMADIAREFSLGPSTVRNSIYRSMRKIKIPT